ncbi:MAG: ribosome biogenesis protein [Nitrososphaerota archaeon]|nr:ribosome biogenesis protein [Nitrososphaerota archaeon]MDG7020609.1 ribosome biogenesis protein [Nitrososphaerota archaeon]
MRNLLFTCVDCSRYTMEAKCQRCGGATKIAAPAKYSPDDRYARYRSPLAYQTGAKSA